MAIVKFSTPKPGDPRTHTSINDITGAMALESSRVDQENFRRHGLDSTNFLPGADVTVHGTIALADVPWFTTVAVHEGNFSSPTEWEIGAFLPAAPLQLNQTNSVTRDTVIRIRASCQVRDLTEGQQVGMAVGFAITGGPLAGNWMLTNSAVRHGGLATSSMVGTSDVCLSTVGALSAASLLPNLNVRMLRWLVWFDNGEPYHDKPNKYFDITMDAVCFSQVTGSDTNSQKIGIAV